jgi:hypothetical protein
MDGTPVVPADGAMTSAGLGAESRGTKRHRENIDFMRDWSCWFRQIPRNAFLSRVRNPLRV